MNADTPQPQPPKRVGMAASAAAVFVVLLLCGGAQAAHEAGINVAAWALLALAAALVAAALVARPAAASSMRLAVVTLGFFALACTLATLTVQRRDFQGQREDQFWQAFKQAQAGLLYRITHPKLPDFLSGKRTTLDAHSEAYFAEMARKLGEKYARKQRLIEIRARQAQAEERTIAQWADRHEPMLRGLYRFMNATRLANAFSAWWFVAIVVLLVVSLAACTAKRLRFAASNLGFIATHAGIIVAALGAFIGSLTIRTGMVGLEAGRQDRASKFIDVRSKQAVPLGFSVKLEAFQTIYHRELLVAFPDPNRPGEFLFERTFKIKPGRQVQLEQGKLSFVVEDVMPEATVDYDVTDDPKAAPNPAARVIVVRSAGDKAAQWLFANADHTYVHPSNDVKVRYAGPLRPAQVVQLLRDATDTSLGVITARDQSNGQQARLEAVVGRAAQLGPYRIEVLACYPDFALRNAKEPGMAFPRNPAVKLRVAKGAESEQRWAFEKLDFDAVHPSKFSDLKLAFAFDPWRSPARRRYLLVGDKHSLSLYTVGKAGPPEPLKLGEPLKLPGSGFGLMVTRVLDRAKERTEIVPFKRPERGFDPLLNPSQPAIKLKVKTPQGEHEHWLLANTALGALQIPGGPTLAYMNNTDKKPIAWNARLGFYEEGERLGSQVVRVNHPARYRGFVFYQWDADSQRPQYAGIRIVRDPGWLFVKTGLLLVLGGIVFMFYVKPFLRSS